MKHDTTLLIDTLLKICSPICKYKNELKINPVETLKSITISVDCHGADYVKLMGAKCKNTGMPCKVYTGLKLIMQAAGKKIGKEIRFEINTPDSIVRENDAFFKPNNSLKSGDFIDLFWDVCSIILEKEFRIIPVDIGPQTTFELYPDPAEGISEGLARALDNVFYIHGNSLGRKLKVECDDTFCDANEDLDLAAVARAYSDRNRKLS